MEEPFREAACLGNCESVKHYLNSGVDVNSQNSVNGWTALHWAVKRGHKDVITILINAGAQQDIENNKGQKPFDLSLNKASAEILQSSQSTKSSEVGQDPGFIPSYLRNPVFPYNSVQQPPVVLSSTASASFSSKNEEVVVRSKAPSQSQFHFRPATTFFIGKSEFAPCGLCVIPEQIVLLVRAQRSTKYVREQRGTPKLDFDNNFIEISLDRCKAPTYSEFRDILAKELNINDDYFIRFIKKLPHTVIRSNSDIQRLTDYQMLEVQLLENFS